MVPLQIKLSSSTHATARYDADLTRACTRSPTTSKRACIHSLCARLPRHASPGCMKSPRLARMHDSTRRCNCPSGTESCRIAQRARLTSHPSIRSVASGDELCMRRGAAQRAAWRARARRVTSQGIQQNLIRCLMLATLPLYDGYPHYCSDVRL